MCCQFARRRADGHTNFEIGIGVTRHTMSPNISEKVIPMSQDAVIEKAMEQIMGVWQVDAKDLRGRGPKGFDWLPGSHLVLPSPFDRLFVPVPGFFCPRPEAGAETMRAVGQVAASEQGGHRRVADVRRSECPAQLPAVKRLRQQVRNRRPARQVLQRRTGLNAERVAPKLHEWRAPVEQVGSLVRSLDLVPDRVIQ